jgi:hypothetical protein
MTRSSDYIKGWRDGANALDERPTLTEFVDLTKLGLPPEDVEKLQEYLRGMRDGRAAFGKALDEEET